MKLAVFDIDGTLIRLEEQFDRCFMDALRGALGDIEYSRDFYSYPHVTDSGIVAEILRRPPTAAENERVQDLYLQSLHAAGGKAIPIAGAEAFLTAAAGDGWTLALATGNWKRAARFKLGAGGWDLDHLPMGSADDSPNRSEIIGAAVRRARGTRDHPVVYFGDGEYDGRAASRAGVGFVHVGPGKDIEDYTDVAAVLARINSIGP